MTDKDYPWVSEKWLPLYQSPKPNDSPELKIERAMLNIEIFESELLLAIAHAKNPNPGGQQAGSFNNEFMNIPLPRLYKIMLYTKRIKNALEGK